MIFTQSGLSVTDGRDAAVAEGHEPRSALRMARVYNAKDPAVGPLVELASKGKYMPMP